MKIRYSASTGTFYPYDIEYSSLPSDLIDVEDADHQRAMSRASGESFAFTNGVLTIIPAQPINPNDTISAKIAELEAGVFLNRGSRELEMRLIEQAAHGDIATLMAQPYYVKLKSMDDEIRALRAQIK